MENILITIGMSVYNAELYLHRAIKSILYQTYENFELIITDDGSSDRSYDIIKSFDDPRIIVIHDCENRGISYRLNQQINIAHGEYFARMDADDVMFPNRIETQVKEFKRYDIDILYSDAISINNKGNIIGYKSSVEIKNSQDILDGKVPIHPTMMARTELLKKYPYNEYIQMEDLDLWYRLVDNYTFKNIAQPLLFYREDSTPNSRKHKKMIQAKRLFASKNNFSLQVKNKLILGERLKYIVYSLFELVKMDRILLKRRCKPINKGDIDIYTQVYELSN